MDGEIVEAPSRKKKLRRNPLGSQTGIIAEMTRLYRRVKAGKLDADEGRARVWMLERIGLRLEALALEKIEAQLERLGGGRVIYDGHEINDQPPQLTN